MCTAVPGNVFGYIGFKQRTNRETLHHIDRSFASLEVENDQSLSLGLSPTPGKSDTSKTLAGIMC